MAGGESSPSDEDDNEMGQVEMHDFGPTNQDNLQDPNSDSKLIKQPPTVVAVGPVGRNRNKVVPIMEVPSSESERSSLHGAVEQPHSARHGNLSVRSQASYGFQPRESAVIRTTSIKSIKNDENLATG